MKFIISTHILSFNYKANIKNILNPHERIRAGAGWVRAGAGMLHTLTIQLIKLSFHRWIIMC